MVFAKNPFTKIISVAFWFHFRPGFGLGPFHAKVLCPDRHDSSNHMGSGLSAAGYIVYYGSSSRNYTSSVNVGNTTSCTLQNLSSQTYYIAVTAYDSNNNQTAYSPELVLDCLTASAGSGGSISPSGCFFQAQGASQTFTITPSSGDQVAGVLVNGGSVGAVTSYTMSAICGCNTISATFSSAPTTTYTISASAGSGGSISPSGAATVTSGSSQSYTITPASGYNVAAVTVDGTSAGAVSSYTFSNVTANHTISATFTAATYTITATAGSNGSISPSGAATVTSGSSQSYTITPASGYNVAAVTVDGTSAGAVSSYTFSNVTANHTISATFTAATYTITATAGSNGSISPSGAATVTSGSGKTYTITPSSGYSVANVTVDGASAGAVSSYTFSNVTANHTISATFTAATYTITATAGSNGSISPSGAATVTSGSSKTYTITPSSGYSVANVTVDGASAGALTSYTFSGVTANHSISATFALTNAPPVADAGPNQTVAEGTKVTLNGSNSTNPGGSPLTSYQWLQTGGPTVNVSNASITQPTITAPSNYTGALTFEFIVKNGNGLTASATSIVNVISKQLPPTAYAGVDQTVTEGKVVTLNGSGSTDPNGCTLTCLWNQIDGPTVTLSSTASSKPTFSAPQTTSGFASMCFQLTVTDKYGLESTDICYVNISPNGVGPQAVPGATQTEAPGAVVSLNGTSSTDADSTIESYLWHQAEGSPETLSAPATASPYFTVNNPGEYGSPMVFRLTVQDLNGLRSRAYQSLDVN